MSRLLRVGLILLILGSCGSREASMPRNLDNACEILTERPYYARAFRATERKWGVQTHILMAMIYQESKFVADIRPPHQYALGVIPTGRQSSALGYSQALNGTWAEYLEEQGRRGADRTNISDAVDFMGWYMNLTVRETGVPLHDARNQYLAYHEGRSGYNRGSYNSKAWLIRVADQVAVRSVMYQSQLQRCRAFR